MKLLLIVLFSITGILANSQVLLLNDTSADVHFITRYANEDMEGYFKGIQGSSVFNEANLEGAYFKMVFAVATAHTASSQMNLALVQADCFNPARYPFIELFSTSIKPLNNDHMFEFNGTLKVKGKTRLITFPFSAVPHGGGYNFSFSFGIRRKAFDLDCSDAGKDIKIMVHAFAK